MMEIKTPATVKTDKYTGYSYILEGKDTILARCNSEVVAQAMADAINNAPRLQAIEETVIERTKNAIGQFDGGHGKMYAYCNDCQKIGETQDAASIKHNRGCLVAALARKL
jgi:hypothetical protein